MKRASSVAANDRLRKKVDTSKPIATVSGDSAVFVEMSNDSKRKYPLVVTIQGVLHTYTDDGRFLTYADRTDLDLRNVA